MNSSVSIALFFLLSGFFLSILIGVIERSRRLLAVSAVCLAAVVCVIVFLTPVRLPNILGWGDDDETGAVAGSTTTSLPSAATSSTLNVTTTTLDSTVITVGHPEMPEAVSD